MKHWMVLGFGLGLGATVVLAACGGKTAGAEGRLTAHGEVYLVRSAGGARQQVRNSAPLRRGDQVQVAGGTADVVLPGGGSVTLRTASVARFLGGPQLDAGDLLVASTTHPLTVTASTGRVVVGGVGRLRRDLALTVAVYRGVATITTAARSLDVPALRQATVANLGLLPSRPSPIALVSDDAWDRHYLGGAIDLTTQLDGASRGYSAEVAAGSGATAAFFRQVLAPLATEVSFSDQLLALTRSAANGERAPGEVLVGASVALSGRPGSFASRWPSVFSFRDDGATWGLVALDQAADPDTVLGLVGQAINRSVLVFTAPVRGVPVPSPIQILLAPPVQVTSPPTTAPKGNVTRPASPPPAKPPEAALPPGRPPPIVIPVLPPTPVSPVLDPLVQLANQFVGGILPGR